MYPRVIYVILYFLTYSSLYIVMGPGISVRIHINQYGISVFKRKHAENKKMVFSLALLGNFPLVQLISLNYILTNHLFLLHLL